MRISTEIQKWTMYRKQKTLEHAVLNGMCLSIPFPHESGIRDAHETGG